MKGNGKNIHNIHIFKTSEYKPLGRKSLSLLKEIFFYVEEATGMKAKLALRTSCVEKENNGKSRLMRVI